MHENLVQRVATTLDASAAYRRSHDRERPDNGHRIIDEGEFRIEAYLREFIGKTVDPHNSEEKRFANDRGTVGLTDAAFASIGDCELSDAVARLEALQIGSRVAAGASFYLRLDVDEAGRLLIEKSRNC